MRIGKIFGQEHSPVLEITVGEDLGWILKKDGEFYEPSKGEGVNYDKKRRN